MNDSKLSPEQFRELKELEERVHPGHAILQAVDSISEEGPEKELRQALGMRDKTILPWSYLVPKPSKRQDTTVDTPSTISAYQQAIAGRVFAQGDVAFLGIRPRLVPVGDGNRLTITAGALPSYHTKDTSPHSAASTLTPTTTSPKTLTASYRIASVDTLRVKGLEAALQDDLAGVLTERMDFAVLNGIPTFIDGLARALTFPAASGAAQSFTTGQKKFLPAIDGKYAKGAGQFCAVVNPETGQHMEEIFHTSSGMSLARWMRESTGGFRVSTNVPNGTQIGSTAVNTNLMFIAKKGPGVGNNTALDVWEGVRVTRDDLTGAQEGNVSIVFHAYHDFKVLRAAGFLPERYNTPR